MHIHIDIIKPEQKSCENDKIDCISMQRNCWTSFHIKNGVTIY